MFRSFFRPASLTVAVLAMFACGDDTPTTPTPTPDPITAVFTGSLNPNGGATHVFYSVTAGVLTSTLTTIEPDSTSRVGLAIGTWNGSACNWIVANDAATTGSVVAGSVTTVGASLCTRIYDVGSLGGSINYTITVVHP